MLLSETFSRYHRMGFSPRPIRGKSNKQEYAVAYYYDNVQYVFNDYGTYEETLETEDMNLCIRNLDYIINSDRHDRVKEVYEFISRQLKVPVWVEITLDTQLGVSFGTDTGSIAQMIMDFPSPELFEKYKEKLIEQLKKLNTSLDLDSLPPIEDVKEFIVIPSEEKYDVVFKDLKVQGVIVEIIDENDDDFFIEIDLDGDDDDDDDE